MILFNESTVSINSSMHTVRWYLFKLIQGIWWLNIPRCTLLLVPNVRFSISETWECVDSFCTGQKGIYELNEQVLQLGFVCGEGATASSHGF